MKKTYIAPEVEMTEVAPMHVIALSTSETNADGTQPILAPDFNDISFDDLEW